MYYTLVTVLKSLDIISSDSFADAGLPHFRIPLLTPHLPPPPRNFLFIFWTSAPGRMITVLSTKKEVFLLQIAR